MGKHHGGSSNAGKKGKGGGKPSTVVTKAVSSKSSKASTDKPAMQSLGDALVHKKGYSPGAKGKGKTNKKDYKKGWEKGAKKYASDKKENNSDANFKSHGKPKTKAPPKTEKEIRMDRKAAKPNFELVESIKTSWNKVRVKSTPDSEKKALLMKMAEQMAGHVQQVTLRHDASRMTQCLLQFGNATQRQAVLTELLEKAVEISKTPYGHFAILKAISYCTGADDQKRICASLKGHFVTLGTNVIGARTVESVCTLYPNKFSRPLRAEFYGHKFTVLLDAPPASLDELLQLQSSKKEAILDHVRDLVQKFVDKGLLEFKYVHDLLWEYTKAVQDDAKRMEDLIQQLADSAPKLITTKPGARAICQVITYSGAKDRKRVIKALKGKVLESLLHDSAHLAIMRLVDVTDDTVSVQKILLDELRPTSAVEKYTATGDLQAVPVPPLVSVAVHRTGRKLLLRLLSPETRHLEPDEEPLFEKSPTSKKEPSARRKEHVVFLRSTILSVFSKYAAILLRDTNGCKVLEQAVTTFYSPTLLEAVSSVFASEEAPSMADTMDDESSDDSDSDSGSEDGDEEEESDDEEKKEKAELKVADEADKDDEEDSDSEDELTKTIPAASIVAIEEDKVAHATLKRLLAVETNVENGSDGIPNSDLWDDEASRQGALSLALFRKVNAKSGLLDRWLDCNRACFALSAMLSVPSAKEEIANTLKQEPYFGKLQSDSAGAKAIVEGLGLKKVATKAKKAPVTRKRKA